MKSSFRAVGEGGRGCFLVALLILLGFVALPERAINAPAAGQCAARSKKVEPERGCLKSGDLARPWPPRNAGIAFRDEVNHQTKSFDFAGVPFNQVKVLSVVCGNLRGRGQEAYFAFETEETRNEERAVLAAFEPA